MARGGEQEWAEREAMKRARKERVKAEVQTKDTLTHIDPYETPKEERQHSQLQPKTKTCRRETTRCCCGRRRRSKPTPPTPSPSSSSTRVRSRR
eukprot:3127553-Rhodomonas_salina.1